MQDDLDDLDVAMNHIREAVKANDHGGFVAGVHELQLLAESIRDRHEDED